MSDYARHFGYKYSHFGEDTFGHDVKAFGDTTGKYFMWDASADKAIVSGVLQTGTTATTALAFGSGTSAAPATTAAADKNFLQMHTESTATSGDSRSAYFRHQLDGTIAATGYGDAVRALTSVGGTGYSYASGLHGTMTVAVGGTVTGSGAGVRATIGAAAATRTLVGALAALQIDSDIGAGNTLPTRCSLLRLAKSGSVDVPYFLDIADDQCLKGSAASGAATDALKCMMPDGSALYLSLIAAS